MVVELSHAFWPGMPKIPVLPDMEIESITSIAAGAPMNISCVRLALHVGTHIDAPVHIVPDGDSIDQIPVQRFLGFATISSVRRKPGELIEVPDVLAGGPEPEPGDTLFINTGWATKFRSAEYTDHPSLSPEVAEWAVERQISMVGVDMSTPDLPVVRRNEGFDFKVHRTLLGAGVLIAENLCNLEVLAGQRVKFLALPLSIVGADAGPARVLAET